MKVVLAGNSHAAIGVLDVLLEMVDPDALMAISPSDRQRHEWQPSLAEAASRTKVQCLQPEDVNADETVDLVGEFQPDLVLSVYYTQLFRAAFQSAARAPIVNAHPSLLPMHRGVAPLIWAIIDGASTTGVTLHHVDAGIDTGDIILQRSLPIHPDDTGYSLHLRASKLVVALAARVLRDFERDGQVAAGREQIGASSYHSSRDPKVNHVDWTNTNTRIRNIVRALAPPLPGAYSTVRGQRLVLERVSVVREDSLAPHPPGTLDTPVGKSGAIVWCGDGAVAIEAAVWDGARCTGLDLVEKHGFRRGEILS